MKIDLRFGKPSSYDYGTIIDQFSGTKINTPQTSSIPLVQFWRNTEAKLEELSNNININFQKLYFCFEYPTPSRGKGKSSMTDLMIIDGDNKIAIEAKYTEYRKKKIRTKSIKQWINEKNTLNRIEVLNGWTEMIKPFSNYLDDSLIRDIEYQFYHRTASACFNSNNAVVIYQLFYDMESFADLEKYIDKLEYYVGLLNPKDNLNFYIWIVETNLIKDENEIDNPFLEMKSCNIYNFKNSEIISINHSK